MTYSLTKTALAAALVVAAGSAFAAPTTFDFADLSWNGTTNSGFLPDSGSGFQCTGGDLCSSNVDGGKFGGNLKYTADGITVKATGWYNGDHVAVVQDHNPNGQKPAGLGVYHEQNNSDDNITLGETLKLSFSQVVNLTSIGLQNSTHKADWDKGAQFQYSQDGATWESKTLDAQKFLNLTGKDFYFRYGFDGKQIHSASQFYLSAMTVTAVPEPETYAMLLAGLGLIGAVKRRKAKPV